MLNNCLFQSESTEGEVSVDDFCTITLLIVEITRVIDYLCMKDRITLYVWNKNASCGGYVESNFNNIADINHIDRLQLFGACRFLSNKEQFVPGYRLYHFCGQFVSLIINLMRVLYGE